MHITKHTSTPVVSIACLSLPEPRSFHPRGSTFFWMGMFSPVIAQVCVCLARRTMHGVRRFFQKHINAYTPAVFWLGSTYPVITQVCVLAVLLLSMYHYCTSICTA